MRGQIGDLWLSALAAVCGFAVAWLAVRFGGFGAMGIAGLLMGYIAVRLDLEKEDVAGGFPSAHLYAKQVAVREQMTRAERASHAADMRSLWRPLVVAKTISAGLVIFGFAGYFLG
jgi:hypothetical protein